MLEHTQSDEGGMTSQFLLQYAEVQALNINQRSPTQGGDATGRT